MAQYIDKDALVAEIERRMDDLYDYLPDASKVESGTITISEACNTGKYTALESFRNYIDTLEVVDPYEQCIQYPTIKDGIQAHAETYSFNIESKLFNQLTKEQQKLWRKEIEQAVISGGYNGLDLARDLRYKESLEVKEVDLNKEVMDWWNTYYNLKDYTFEGYAGHYLENSTIIDIAKHFYELGLKASCSVDLTPDLDTLLEEKGIDPYSKEAKIFKEAICKATEKYFVKAQKGE